jgi:hypothetical protein
MFFEVFQACVDDLLHAEHFAAEKFFAIVNVPVSLVYAPVSIGKPDIDLPICICEANSDMRKTKVHRPREIVQTLIIGQYADKRGNCWESGCGNRQHQLFGSNHSFTSLPVCCGRVLSAAGIKETCVTVFPEGVRAVDGLRGVSNAHRLPDPFGTAESEVDP